MLEVVFTEIANETILKVFGIELEYVHVIYINNIEFL